MKVLPSTVAALLAASCAHLVSTEQTEGGPKVEEPCPNHEPAPDSSCATAGEKCSYLSGDRCGRVFQCYLGQWKQAAEVACSPDVAARCPASADEALVGKSGDTLECLYRGDVLCSFEYPQSQPVCSGVARLPDPHPSPPPIPTWRCRRVAFDPCRSRVNENEPCAPHGLTCGVTCCGMGATCVEGHWKTQEYPCPP